MPTIYGEGRNVFYRLQEEIVKSSVDNTFLAWGLNFPHDPVTSIQELRLRANFIGSRPPGHALAPSPGEFRSSGNVRTGYPGAAKWKVCLLSINMYSFVHGLVADHYFPLIYEVHANRNHRIHRHSVRTPYHTSSVQDSRRTIHCASGMLSVSSRK